jgi:hypothetical protein
VDFAAYRATEADETFSYTKLSHEAPGSTIDELDGVDDAIVKVAHAASAKPNDLRLSGMKLSALVLQFEIESREALAPHADFMVNHGAAMPDMTSSAMRSINGMLGYVDQRVKRSDATAKGLLLGSNMRRTALQLLADASSPARTTIASALVMKASTSFQDASATRVDAIVAAPKTSAKLALPYLADRYDAYRTLLQTQPLCNAKTSSWREAGCEPLRAKYKDAATYLTITLPSQIKAGLEAMKNQGVEQALIDRAQKKLDAGDIKGAALVHDALLREVEGT